MNNDWMLFLYQILPFEFLSYPFMRQALIAILLLTPLLGLMGTMAVNQRMAFFSDALGHSALTGIGIGILLNVNQLTTMLIFGVLWALLISHIKQTGKSSADTVISVFSSTSVALGLIILSKGGGFARYSSLLVGDILTISKSDLWGLLIALLLGVFLWGLIYNRLLLSSINGPLARSRGVSTRIIEGVFVILIAVSVMLAIRWVGILLINALLILPAAAGRNFAKSSRAHAGFSVLIAITSGVAGLILSYYLNTSAGATIVLCAALWYFLSLAVSTLSLRRQKNH
ncbi:MAG: metal ABC transporter permease [Clostridiales bacterium]|nr:metal ABC transporter permease [Clostridiales bacterium]